MASDAAEPRNGGPTIRMLSFVTTGMRADVTQHFSLAQALKRDGFLVTILSNAIHEDLARIAGCAFVPLKGDPHALLKGAAFREAVESETTGMLKMATIFKGAAEAVLEENMDIMHQHCRKSDGILCALPHVTECMAVAQKYQIPLILCPLLPFSPNGEIPVAHLLPEPSKWAWLNRLTYDVSGLLLWMAMGARYNRFRTHTLGIGPQSGFVLDGITQVAGFASAVVEPRPADWGTYIHTCGAWNFAPEEAISRFQRAAPKLSRLIEGVSSETRQRPILVTFDAIPVAEPVAFIRTLHQLSERIGVPFIFAAGSTDVDAAQSSALLDGCPGIVWEVERSVVSSGVGSTASGSGEGRGGAGADATAGSGSEIALVGDDLTGAVTTRVHIVREVYFPTVLRSCSAVVHQGSALITQSAMEAGIPQVIFPSFGDQYFWAARVAMLGLGPIVYYSFRHVGLKLAEELKIARFPRIVAQAAEFSKRMRRGGSSGATSCRQAVDLVRHLLTRPQNRACGITCAWAADGSTDACTLCRAAFTLTNRRHHCRSCGRLVDGACVGRCHLPGYPSNAPQLACTACMTARKEHLAAHPPRQILPKPLVDIADSAAPTIVDVPLDSPEEGSVGGMTTPTSAARVPRPHLAAATTTTGGISAFDSPLPSPTPSRGAASRGDGERDRRDELVPHGHASSII